MHGHVVLDGAAPVQCAAGTTTVGDGPSDATRTESVIAFGDVLRCSFGAVATTESTPSERFVQGLTASVTIVPRNGDGFGADVWLQWNGPVDEALLAWLDRAPPELRCRGSLGWMAPRAAVAAARGGG